MQRHRGYMRDKILEIIKEKPKHYSLFIKKNIEMSEWIQKNSITDSDDLFCIIQRI